MFSSASCYFLSLIYIYFFSITLSVYYSHRARDQVSHPYKTADKIIVLYILVFYCLYRRREVKIF
jgi:hypothetical protein